MIDRRILHVDMDAFYAAVEQRDHPELAGKPVIVGGAPGGRGVVSSASYEARRFGVRSAIPCAQARKLCPEAVFLPVRMERYREASAQVFDIFDEFTPVIEPVSIDEAFLDVTGSEPLFGPAAQIARHLKQRIREVTGLTASIGVAPNKHLAKLASDVEKPDGLVVVAPDSVQAFLAALPVERLCGAGPATVAKLRSLGLRTVGDVARYPVEVLKQKFGKHGAELHALASGHDDRPVERECEAKSRSRETTFEEDVSDYEVLETVLLDLSDHVAWRLRRNGLIGRTVILKVRYPDFTTVTRARKLGASAMVDTTEVIYETARDLLRCLLPGGKSVRLLGVGVSELSEAGAEQQLPLFDELAAKRKVAKAVDRIRERHGEKAITRARLISRER